MWAIVALGRQEPGKSRDRRLQPSKFDAEISRAKSPIPVREDAGIAHSPGQSIA